MNKKRNKAFVPPDGTKPIAPTKDERKEYVDGGKEGHNPLLSREDAKRLRDALRKDRRGGGGA